jgi:hypothetical protein
LEVEVRTTVVLSEKEQEFIYALCRGLKPTGDAQAAGFSQSVGPHLLVRPHINAALKTISANLASVVAKAETLGVRQPYGRCGG